MNKRKKQAYALLIGLLAVVLVLDLLSEGNGTTPASARSAPAPRRTIAVARSTTPDAADSPAVIPARFPDDLPTDPRGQRDLFQPGAATLRTLAGAGAVGAGTSGRDGRAKAARTRATAESFAAEHTITAVVSSGTLAMARIDGTWMAVGQTLDGFKLVRLEGQSAIFEGGGRTVILSVDGHALSGAGQSAPNQPGDLKDASSGVDMAVEQRDRSGPGTGRNPDPP